jgi:hypothetical protein
MSDITWITQGDTLRTYTLKSHVHPEVSPRLLAAADY